MPIKIGICATIVAGFWRAGKWCDAIGAVGLREAWGSSGVRANVMWAFVLADVSMCDAHARLSGMQWKIQSGDRVACVTSGHAGSAFRSGVHALKNLGHFTAIVFRPIPPFLQPFASGPASRW